MVYVILRIRRVGHRVHPSRFRLDVTSSICNLATAAGHEQSCVALSIACEPQAEDCGSPKPRTSSLSSACRTHTHTHTMWRIYVCICIYMFTTSGLAVICVSSASVSGLNYMPLARAPPMSELFAFLFVSPEVV